MVECRQHHNVNICTCTYEPCKRKGNCCLCINYHKTRSELPGCLFPREAEKTYDRSIANFVAVHS